MLTFERCVADVAEFQTKFGMTANPLDNLDMYELRVKRLNEELIELNQSENSADAADAVIDILYVAAGTYFLLGDRNAGIKDHTFICKEVLVGIHANLVRQFKRLPLEQLWEEVHRANLDKMLGTKYDNTSFAKHDVIKPEGWVGPKIEQVMYAHNLNPLAGPMEYFDDV